MLNEVSDRERQILYDITYMWDLKKKQVHGGTSLVVQWLRLRLPAQRVQVQSLVRELNPTGLTAKRPKQRIETIL